MLRPMGNVNYKNEGRVIIVTGGCSGIGLAVCQAFLESGAQVICADVNELPACSNSHSLVHVKTDTSKERDCRRAIESTIDQFGAIDVLVNNAAIQPAESYRPVDRLDSDVWAKMLAVNLSGYHFMAKHVFPQMVRQNSGVVVNMASGQAHRTCREVPAYGPIKAANVMQTRQWGVEYARYGIRVVSVSPGAIDTPLVRASLEAQGGGAQLANRHPLGRIGRSDEVAAAVLWLASSAASFVTGTDLEVDGGLGAFGAFGDPYPKASHDP